MDFIKAEEKEGFFLLKIRGPLSPISHNLCRPFSTGQPIVDFYYYVYSSIEDPPHLTGNVRGRIYVHGSKLILKVVRGRIYLRFFIFPMACRLMTNRKEYNGYMELFLLICGRG